MCLLFLYWLRSIPRSEMAARNWQLRWANPSYLNITPRSNVYACTNCCLRWGFSSYKVWGTVYLCAPSWSSSKKRQPEGGGGGWRGGERKQKIDFLLTQERHSEIPYLIFSGVFFSFLCFWSVRTPLYTIDLLLFFPRFFLRSRTCALRLTAVFLNMRRLYKTCWRVLNINEANNLIISRYGWENFYLLIEFWGLGKD